MTTGAVIHGINQAERLVGSAITGATATAVQATAYPMAPSPAPALVT